MEKVWYQDHFPVGMVIKGETVKDLAEKGLFDVAFSVVNDDMIPAGEENMSLIDDQETWIIGLNTNSKTIMLIQLFTANRVIIETSTKLEIKEPSFDFAYAQ